MFFARMLCNGRNPRANTIRARENRNEELHRQGSIILLGTLENLMVIYLRVVALSSLVVALLACGGGGSGSGGGNSNDNPPSANPLTVVATNPPATAVGASLLRIEASFSNVLDLPTVNISSFTVVGPNGPVSGAVSVNGQSATFTPTQALAFETDYTATLTTAIRDQSNQQLANSHSWRFNTGKQLALSMDDGNHTCARLIDGRVKCWGFNVYGQLGQGDTLDRGNAPNQMGSNLPAINLGTDRSAVQIVTGRDHVCARLDNLAVKCWGKGSVLGLGSSGNNRGDAPTEMGDNLPPVDLGSGRIALELVAGGEHTCARLDNGRMKCWGNGIALGLGDPNNRGDTTNEMGDLLPYLDFGANRTVMAIYAGWAHTCARLDNNAVKCWGYNGSGQLGTGDTVVYGTTAQTVPAMLPALDIGSGRTVTNMALGGQHSCAILDNNQIKCWGENAYGELGLGDTLDRGDNPNEMGDMLATVNLGTGRSVVSLVAGYEYNCAILDNRELKCWGFQGATGNLGNGSQGGNGVGDVAGEMGDDLNAVNVGSNLFALEVVAGVSHTCARLGNGQIKCWGVNSGGQLGLGDTITRGDEIAEMGDNLPAVDLGP